MEGKTPHILTTASNLLGFGFLVLTSMKGFGLPHSGFVDESIAITIVLLAASCLFSLASMRTKSAARAHRFETVADYMFLVGLITIVVLSSLLAFDILRLS